MACSFINATRQLSHIEAAPGVRAIEVRLYLFIYLFKQCLKRMTQLAINNYSTL